MRVEDDTLIMAPVEAWFTIIIIAAGFCAAARRIIGKVARRDMMIDAMIQAGGGRELDRGTTRI